MSLKCIVILLALATSSWAYPYGAPMEACTAFYPVGHNATALNPYDNSTNPFMLSLSKTQVKQGESVSGKMTLNEP